METGLTNTLLFNRFNIYLFAVYKSYPQEGFYNIFQRIIIASEVEMEIEFTFIPNAAII